MTDTDRHAFIETLDRVVSKYNWLCYAYCLMDNHYHLLVETIDANLSTGMRQLNGVYTQRFNRRHHRVGHLLQGRYKSILIEKNQHLLELCRYIVLNPVRAGMVNQPMQWKWSSYRTTAYAALKPPEFLSVNWILAQFGPQTNQARKAYRKFVVRGMETPKRSPWERLVGQIVFGGAEFVADIQSILSTIKEVGEIPRVQRFPGRPPLSKLFAKVVIMDKATRNKQIVVAHLQYGYTLKAIADQLKLHYTTISKVLKHRES